VPALSIGRSRPQPELDPGGRVFFNSAANASAGAKAAREGSAIRAVTRSV
jgi:hypothetical protein